MVSEIQQLGSTWARFGRGAALLGELGPEQHTDDQGNHAGAISTGGLEALDKLLDLPDLDLPGILLVAHGHHGRAVNVRNSRSSQPRWRWGRSW